MRIVSHSLSEVTVVQLDRCPSWRVQIAPVQYDHLTVGIGLAIRPQLTEGAAGPIALAKVPVRLASGENAAEGVMRLSHAVISRGNLDADLYRMQEAYQIYRNGGASEREVQQHVEAATDLVRGYWQLVGWITEQHCACDTLISIEAADVKLYCYGIDRSTEFLPREIQVGADLPKDLPDPPSIKKTTEDDEDE